MAVSIGSLKYIVGADISDYTSKMAQLKALRKTASKEEKEAIDKQIKLLRDQQRKEKQILRDRSKAYNDFANTIRSSVKWISVGLVGIVATASKNLMDAEKETKNLSAALSNLGLNNQGLLSTLTDLADQINEVTGINQQLINDAMAIGLQFGIAQDDIDEYAKALAALSSISGKSIQQLAQSLNQMYIKGDFSSLEKLGIYIDQNKSKQQQFNDVIAQGLGKYNELNNQTSGTLTRNMQVFGNVAGSVFEEIGKRINDNVIAPLAKWFGTNRELIIKVASESADTITANWKHVLTTLLTLYSTFNKAVRTQTDTTWSDIKTVITDNWRKSGQSVDLFRDKINRMYRSTTNAINALVDWNNMTIDQRRNVILNKDHTVLNRIIASADLLHIKAGKTNKEFFDINKTISTTNKILLTTGKILLNNVVIVKTLRVAVSGVITVVKVLNGVLGVTRGLIKGIARATVIMAVFEAAIWAVEKAWDSVVWAIEKAWDGVKAFGEYLHKIGLELGIIDAEQEKINNLISVNKSLADQIKTANDKNSELTKQLSDETDKQIKQEIKKNKIKELESQINDEQNEQIKEQLKTQLEQTKQLQEINNKNTELEKKLNEQNKQIENIEENEEETTEQIKTQNVELSNQVDTINSLYTTTADLNKSWNNMVHPITNINVLYHEYKNLQQEIADKQQEIYSNQQNVLIDVETKNKRNIDLVNQYNDLLKRRNTLTQSLLSAKQKQREEEEKAAAAEQERIKKQLEEQKALNIKRQQLKLQLEIAKAENSSNKDRTEALRIGQEVTNIAKEYKISIEDALKVYRTLNAEKNAGKEGYDAEGNKLTKAQLRRQKRAQEKLKRYEESQATAPGEQRKTGVRRISASKSAVERWRREAVGNFTGRDIKPVSERITANQIKANIPDASGITPITPSTTGISDQTQISTPQTTAGKSDNILNQIVTKIDQMVSGFDTFTQQFAQTFSA